MADEFLELDVRPILRAGGEPFQAIMGAIQKLQPGQGLRLLATFKPVPLFGVLGKKGFSHEEREIGDGDWEVLFRPQDATADAGTPIARSDPADPSSWPAPSQHMDNRDLDPPEPMVRILAAIESMREGEVLSALLQREPAFLIPELDKRGHAWAGDFEDDRQTFHIRIRIGAGKS